jgi:hypothetical protein
MTSSQANPSHRLGRPATIAAAAVLTAIVALAAGSIQADAAPKLTAHLMGPQGEKLAPSDPGGAVTADWVTVHVQVEGVELIDPALAGEKPVAGQGHLHYRVDRQPMVATPATVISFHELGPGPHTITVMLAANDHTPLGPEQTLRVNGSASAPARPEATAPGTNPTQSGMAAGDPMTKPSATDASMPKLNARLLSKEEKAKGRAATVEVDLAGVELKTPPVPGATATWSMGTHLHYRVDNGAVIAAAEKKMSFHELDPGPHTITVALANADHTQLGPQTTLEVTIPVPAGSATSY